MNGEWTYLVFLTIVGLILLAVFIVGRRFERGQYDQKLIKDILNAKKSGQTIDGLNNQQLAEWVYRARK